MAQALLNRHKIDILKYLFDTDKELDKFEKNEDVKLSKNWDPILNYPDELHSLKRTITSKTVLITRVVDSLLKNIDRVIHPILLIIFNYELRDYIKFNEMSRNTETDPIVIQLTSKNKKYLKELRPQLNATFKLYWKLINDPNIIMFKNQYIDNEIVEEFINSLYYQVTVEKLIKLNKTCIETKKIRFNDVCLSLDVDEEILKKNMTPINYDKYLKNKEILNEKQQEFQTKILIEINESHHMPNIDFLRKTTIYETTSKTLIDYNLSSDTIDQAYTKILKEIAKTIYKNYDKDLGFIFYLTTIENMEIKDAIFFLELYNTTKNKEGVPIKIILNIFNEWEFVNKSKFLKLIKKELNSDEYFVIKNDDIKSCYLSSLGVDRLIFLPRNDDFVQTDEIKMFVAMYTKFRESFFKTIENFLNNGDENNIVLFLLKKLTSKEDFDNFKEPLINLFLEKLNNEDLINKVQEKYNIELDKYLPILMKSTNKYHTIDTIVMKNSLGDKVANIIEERFDTCKSEIPNRTIIPKDVIEYIFNHKNKKK